MVSSGTGKSTKKCNDQRLAWKRVKNDLGDPVDLKNATNSVKTCQFIKDL